MAARKAPPPPAPAKLSPQQMTKGISRLNRVIAEIEAFDESVVRKRFSPEQRALEGSIEGALVSVFGHDTVEYRRFADATQLDTGPLQVSYDFMSDHVPDDGHLAPQYLAEGKAASITILKAAIKLLQEELIDAGDSGSEAGVDTSAKTRSNKIFIVHGHDDAARLEVARFLEQLGFDAIILSEQASQGRTIIEKIDAHSDVGFAVVLLTPDDVGGKDASSLKPRARQNVLLELGFFIAKLSRANVCALRKGDVEIPTDFAGVVWTDLDSAGGWKQALAKELDASGYYIDFNRVMRSRR